MISSTISCKTDQKAATENVDTPSVENKKEGDKKEPAKEEGVSVYPGFDLGKLKPEHRKLFVDIAKTEICPCKDSEGKDVTSTLHECLQSNDPKIRCAVSMQGAEIIAIMANAGMGKTDIYEKLHGYIDSTKKQHVFNLKNVPVKGNKDAKVILVEFADFQCSHCSEAAKVFDKISKKMGTKIGYYFKNFPLGSPTSTLAASAALAAHQQNKFWPMHDLLFKNQRILDEDKIQTIAQKIGLNMKRFNADLKNPEVIAQVNIDRGEGEKAGLSGTPTLYINGRLYLGEKSEEDIIKEIEKVLSETP